MSLYSSFPPLPPFLSISSPSISLFLSPLAPPLAPPPPTLSHSPPIVYVQGVRVKFDSRRVFRKKQYISAKKADIFENQKVLIISAPRRQIATTVVPLASTTTWRCFPELVEITVSLPLLKIQDNTSVLGLSLALVLYMTRLIPLFITPGTW